MKIYLDANVIIDYFEGREFKNSNVANVIENTDPGDLYTSTLNVHIVFYILKVKFGTPMFDLLSLFFTTINLISLSDVIVNRSLGIPFTDYEDVLQFLSAQESSDVVLTRNLRDFNKIKQSLKSDIDVTSFLE
jgi:hypothetical protein